VRRTQSSIAVSADGDNWFLCNASPDLGQQIVSIPALQTNCDSGRHSPIVGAVLTNGDVDHVTGLLTLRESHPLAVYATGRVQKVLKDNKIFNVLNPDFVDRRVMEMDTPIELKTKEGKASGIIVEPFTVPGKIALWLEDESAENFGSQPEDTIALKISSADGASSFFYMPGCAEMPPELADRLTGAELVFFDGTLWNDDEMKENQVGIKTWRPHGAYEQFRFRWHHLLFRAAGRETEDFYSYQQYQSHPVGGFPPAQGSRIYRMGGKLRRNGDYAVSKEKMLSRDEMEATLRKLGDERYHNLHKFHKLLHGGKLNKGQVQAWALNRYYYQIIIPVKDTALMSRMRDPDLRRIWIQRVVDHDGAKPGDGGIERWLKLTDGLGLDREYVKSTDGLLPGTRFAVDCYVTYVKEYSVLEGMTSSLTELFAPSIHRERIAGMLKNYDFIHDDIMAYFKKRLDQAPRDAEHVLELALSWPQSRAEQQGVIDSLIFKLDCLWAQQDALYDAYVEATFRPAPSCQRISMTDRVLIDEDSIPKFPVHVKLRFNKQREQWVVLLQNGCWCPTKHRLKSFSTATARSPSRELSTFWPRNTMPRTRPSARTS
jgi:coenzyme PQQ biosynthesis protein C/coenzyme PQQ biosynthesis protein B